MRTGHIPKRMNSKFDRDKNEYDETNFIYILLGIMLLSIVSCYDDEGNYDYHDINEVTFGEINTMYNVLLNIDTLKN